MSNHLKSLEAKLAQLYQERLGGKARYEIIPLGDSKLIRIHTDEGPSHLILDTRKIGEHAGHLLVLARGLLLKPEGEFIKFDNLLAFPQHTPIEALRLTEDFIVETRGIIISAEGKKLEFRDRNPQFDSFLESGCAACKEHVDYKSTYVARKVGSDRCRLCTSVALTVGVLLSGLIAWLFKTFSQVVDGDVLGWVIFLLGMVFTAWRVWYWGYLPLQDLAAKRLQAIVFRWRQLGHSQDNLKWDWDNVERGG